MAKTLVGLYDTLTDAEQVVHDLGMEGFPRGGIRVAAAQGAAVAVWTRLWANGSRSRAARTWWTP